MDTESKDYNSAWEQVIDKIGEVILSSETLREEKMTINYVTVDFYNDTYTLCFFVNFTHNVVELLDYSFNEENTKKHIEELKNSLEEENNYWNKVSKEIADKIRNINKGFNNN